MTPFDLAAIKSGWIPLLHEEPVYFKYREERDEFWIVMCPIKSDHYDLYNKWIKERRITQESLDKRINTCINAAFSLCICTPQSLQKAILFWINDYRYHNIIGKDYTKEKFDKNKGI